MSKYVGFRQGKVHESHVISEYYCGGCGWPVTDHDSYCPECGGAFRESDADDALEAENAKLRELVRHLRECTRHNVCALCEYAEEACDFDYDMRELGIEVDA